MIKIDASSINEEFYHWIDNKFVPYREIFPEWKNGYKEINKFCDNFKYDFFLEETNIKINVKITNINFNVKIPNITFRDLESRFLEIYEGCLEDYFKIQEFVGMRSCEETEHFIRNTIKSRESSILYSGGRSFKEELKFRMGVL